LIKDVNNKHKINNKQGEGTALYVKKYGNTPYTIRGWSAKKRKLCKLHFLYIKIIVVIFIYSSASFLVLSGWLIRARRRYSWRNNE